MAEAGGRLQWTLVRLQLPTVAEAVADAATTAAAAASVRACDVGESEGGVSPGPMRHRCCLGGDCLGGSGGEDWRVEEGAGAARVTAGGAGEAAALPSPPGPAAEAAAAATGAPPRHCVWRAERLSCRIRSMAEAPPSGFAGPGVHRGTGSMLGWGPCWRSCDCQRATADTGEK